MGQLLCLPPPEWWYPGIPDDLERRCERLNLYHQGWPPQGGPDPHFASLVQRTRAQLALDYIAELLRDAGATQRELEGRPNICEERDAQFAGQPIDTAPDKGKAKNAADRRAN